MWGATVQTPQDWITNQIIHIKVLMSPASDIAENRLVGCQHEQWLLGLQGSILQCRGMQGLKDENG